MTELCNLFISGKAGISEWWLNSQLICIVKPDQSLRPIGVQNVFVRLFSSTLGKIATKDVVEALKEQNQLGIGVAGGCEAVAHYAVACGEKIRLGLSNNKILIKLDVSNAFNEVYRKDMRMAILKECPRLITFFDFAFQSPTKLFSKDGTLMMEASRGTIQGNGISGLLFCLAQKMAITKTLASCGGVEIVSQYDDSFIYGTSEDCSIFFQEFENNLLDIGLRIKRAECKVIHGDIDVSNLPVEIQRVDGFKAVGIPIGDEEYINEFLEQKKQKLFKLINDIHYYLQGHADHAFHLLRSCINTIGSYLGRIILPNTFENFAEEFDKTIDHSIARFIGRDILSPVGKLIRQLPAKTGGNGLYSLALSSKIGFVYSWIMARNTFGPGFWHGIDMERKEAVTAIFPDSNLNQNFITSVTQRDTFAKFLLPIKSAIGNQLSELDMDIPGLAWFKSVIDGKVEQFWINSIFSTVFSPNGSPVAMPNEHFVMMWRYSLLDSLVPAVPFDTCCLCRAAPRVKDPQNKYHSLSCQQGNKIQRHDDIAKTLEKVVLHYGGQNVTSVAVPKMIGVNRQSNVLSTFKGDLALSITLMDGHIGNFNIDVSIVNQSCKSNCNKSIEAVLRAREVLKENHYNQVTDHFGFDRLVPFVLSTSGVLGEKAKIFLTETLIPRLDPSGEIGFVRKLMRSIAFTLYNHICLETLSYNRCINTAFRSRQY
jgi:hypothetical protein